MVKVTTETAFQGWHHLGLGVQRKEMTPPQISGPQRGLRDSHGGLPGRGDQTRQTHDVTERVHTKLTRFLLVGPERHVSHPRLSKW